MISISKNIKRKGIFISSLFLVGMILSCTNEAMIKDPDLSTSGEGEKTYANIKFSIGPDVLTRSTLETGDDKESALNNMVLMFFGNDNRLELKLKLGKDDFQAATPVPEVATGSYILKEPVQVLAGKKKVVALLNCNDGLFNKIGNVTTYNQIMDFVLNTNASKYSSYMQEQGVRIIESGKRDVGVNYWHDYDNLLMTGEVEANLLPGVTKNEAKTLNKNYIDNIQMYRTMAKVTFKYTSLTGIEGLNYVDDTKYLVFFGLGNLPNQSYLLKQNNNVSPNYSSTDFNAWSMLDESQEYYLNNVGIINVPKHRYTLYIPENTISIPYRGNATYLWLRVKLSYYDETNKSRGHFWCFYDENTKKTFYVPLINGVHDYHLDVPINDWTELQKGVIAFFKEKVGLAQFDEKQIILMPKYDRTKEYQDQVLRQKLGDGVIPNGKYIFFYRTDVCDPERKTERWYDEIQLYNYTGKDFERNGRMDYKAAFYNTANTFHRINIEDPEAEESSNKRYCINRNTWYDITITGLKSQTDGFNAPGYPRMDDLKRNKDGKLLETTLSATIKVVKWKEGGTSEVIIGKD